jgi:hypothetical protein
MRAALDGYVANGRPDRAAIESRIGPLMRRLTTAAGCGSGAGDGDKLGRTGKLLYLAG